MEEQALATLIVFLVITLGIFLIGREIVCWYFKVHEVIAELKIMNQHLEIISRAAQPQQPQMNQPMVNPAPQPGGLKGFNPKLPVP